MRATASWWIWNSGNTILKKNNPPTPQAVLADTLIHTRSRYRYVGEKGQEYRTVYSIFRELNTRANLTNAHILWYAAIWCLVERSSAERRRTQAGMEPLARLIDRFITGDSRLPEAPRAIQTIDRFIGLIVHSGILICRGGAIDRGYLVDRLPHLTGLLEEITTALRPDRRDDTVYILSVDAACENLKKLMTAAKVDFRRTVLRQMKTRAYQKNIASVAGEVGRRSVDPYFHIEDFWNGIVP
jgi:hypothetical protein